MLKLIDKINEANLGNTKEKYADLYKGIREKCPLLKDADDLTLKELCRKCYLATGITLPNMTPENFYEQFFKDYKSLGDFILDYDDELSVETIIKLGKKDPKFVKSLEKLYNLSGYSTVEEDELTFEDLVRWLYIEGPSTPIKVDLTDVSDEDIIGKTDAASNKYNKTRIDADALAKGSKILKAIYKDKYLKEDKEEVEPISNPDEKGNINNISFGISDALNGLVQNIWGIISDIKSIIASMKEGEVKVNEKEKIEKILNSVIDDFTIDLGMLTRASSLLDYDKSAELMNKGTEKAEEIISSEE